MRKQNVLEVFVASPNDVEPEREALEEVIKEVNNTWSTCLGIELNLT